MTHADRDELTHTFDEADYPLTLEEEAAIASLACAERALRKVRAVSRRRYDEIRRLREELEEVRALARELLAAWREADYHWSLEFGPVPERWEDWTPASELVPRAVAVLGLGPSALMHPDCPQVDWVLGSLGVLFAAVRCDAPIQQCGGFCSSPTLLACASRMPLSREACGALAQGAAS